MFKLSIITINRNNSDGLKRTIESVVCQTFRDFEYIVIDELFDDFSKIRRCWDSENLYEHQ